MRERLELRMREPLEHGDPASRGMPRHLRSIPNLPRLTYILSAYTMIFDGPKLRNVDMQRRGSRKPGVA